MPCSHCHIPTYMALCHSTTIVSKGFFPYHCLSQASILLHTASWNINILRKRRPLHLQRAQYKYIMQSVRRLPRRREPMKAQENSVRRRKTVVGEREDAMSTLLSSPKSKPGLWLLSSSAPAVQPTLRAQLRYSHHKCFLCGMENLALVVTIPQSS